jgi:hypothetical protein
MVTISGTVAVVSRVLLAEQPADPLMEQLDPPRRAAVVMALLALVMTGLLLVTCVMLGARWVRRLARHQASGRVTDDVDAAARNRRLRESLESVLPEVKTDETVELGKSARETKLDL